MDSRKTRDERPGPYGSGQWLSLRGSDPWELGEDRPQWRRRWRQILDRLSDGVSRSMESNRVLAALGLVLLGAGLILALYARSPEWVDRFPSAALNARELGQEIVAPLGAGTVLAGGLPTIPDELLILEPEAAPDQRPAAAGSFFVRVASFRNPANADRLVKSLQQDMAGVQAETHDGGLLVVLVGPFEGRDTARATARLVEGRSGLMPQIIERN